MEEIINVKDEFYILASSSTANEVTRVLKDADTFLVVDSRGNIKGVGRQSDGLFHEGTRFLSQLLFKFENTSPLFLSSKITEKNGLLIVDLTNHDFTPPDGGELITKGLVHIFRSILLWEGCYYEQIRFSNFGLGTVSFKFSFDFAADYRDVFEVRGSVREKRGEYLPPVFESKSIILSYKGLDGIIRKTDIRFSHDPLSLTEKNAIFIEKLASKESRDFYLTVACESDKQVPIKTHEGAIRERTNLYQKRYFNNACYIESSNEQFNEWINSSQIDLFMMITNTKYGYYPYAGIPWYSTVFGRDGIITAFETLWPYPEIAKGVLKYLAAKQGTSVNREQDCEPGKILHEERQGEMANLKEIPFGLYYGTVDATPLFVILAVNYYERTGDIELISDLWPHIEKAIYWIDKYGDLDGDGFVEYARQDEHGLSNQGWKDSWDAIFHADGSLASAPIALCEVQGYVYHAKIKAATLAFLLGHKKFGEQLLQSAETLKEKFQKEFWNPELKSYALALDGHKQQCKVLSSNAGQCLLSGIASPEHAFLITSNLMNESFLTSWGIRTIASTEVRYNPLSYHNGSIWPHDNALIAYGMSRYGYKNEVIKILSSLFDASIYMPLHRLPELLCGLTRRTEGGSPTLYPVACNPQAWSTASVFLLIQSCLGLTVNAREKKIFFKNPILPPFLDSMTVRNLRVGNSSIDFSCNRYEKSVAINILKKEGDIGITIDE